MKFFATKIVLPEIGLLSLYAWITALLVEQVDAGLVAQFVSINSLLYLGVIASVASLILGLNLPPFTKWQRWYFTVWSALICWLAWRIISGHQSADLLGLVTSIIYLGLLIVAIFFIYDRWRDN